VGTVEQQGSGELRPEEPDAVHPTKIQRDWFPTNKWEQIGERLFNLVVTRVPSHWIRLGTLRLFGAKIGRRTSINLGTRVLGIQQLIIGDNCSIGFRCLLDARGGIVIDHDVVLASDVQLISGQHTVNSNDFGQLVAPIYIDHHVWIASRSMVVIGVHIGAGAVVGACSMVRSDVESMAIVAGMPAVKRGVRTSSLAYHPDFRPMFY